MVIVVVCYLEICVFLMILEVRVDLNGCFIDFYNINVLVCSDNWEIGVLKIGYISEVGCCLVM